MKKELYDAYLNILKEELIPAMGCTEPIAIAYAAAVSKRELGLLPETIEINVSGNIVKNVKSVIVPNTNGLKGIAAAAASGIIAGNPDKQLEVISDVTKEEIETIKEYLNTAKFNIQEFDSALFDIAVKLTAKDHYSLVRISGYHTNIVRIEKDGQVLLNKKYSEETNCSGSDHSVLNVENIIEFADTANLTDVDFLLDRQIKFNTAIAREGLNNSYGANIGNILLKSYGVSVHNRAKAMAAAGSDARMSGCELPVVINSGSGNQGITCSLPVIVYADELNVSKDILYRALLVSNLVTIHLKTGIGRLSAYCGATSAGCGAGAGVTYLYGGKYHEIAHTIVNALAINSGVICDGAKPSCAAKIASAVEAGLLGMQMQMHNSQFYSGDGIVTKGVENTIKNVGELARNGMRETDKEIIRIMIDKI